MNDLRAVLAVVVRALEECRIPYMVTGGVALGSWSLSRATHDFDIVVALEAAAIEPLRRALGSDFYFDSNEAARAVSERDLFNAIHQPTGLKVDYWPVADTAYDREAFARRSRREFLDTQAFVCTPEDLILSKLRWHAESQSERQWTDALSVARVQAGMLDLAYLQKWSNELGLTTLLERLLATAQE